WVSLMPCAASRHIGIAASAISRNRSFHQGRERLITQSSPPKHATTTNSADSVSTPTARNTVSQICGTGSTCLNVASIASAFHTGMLEPQAWYGYDPD